MVKVIEKSEEELKLDIKLGKLEEIANNFSKKVSVNIVYPNFLIIFEDGKDVAVIYPKDNSVSIKKPESFETVCKLAEAFEEYTKVNGNEKEWTLKKDYME